MATISQTTINNILAHLEINAPTDAWARQCLEQLKKEAMPALVKRAHRGADLSRDRRPDERR